MSGRSVVHDKEGAETALGPRADLDGSRAVLVSAPEETPLASLDYELTQLQILYGGTRLICLYSWGLQTGVLLA